MYYYGESLKEFRLSKKKTLKQLSDETGISFQNLSRWERGEVLPNIDFCVQLAKYYGVTVDELIGKDVYQNNSKEIFEYNDGTHYIKHKKN